MRVEVITATKRPMDVIAQVAGTSYGKNDVNHRRVLDCFKRRHMSVFEHASATFRIEGISRACSHQLVRHRMASFIQESQRYTKIEGDDWYVTPGAFQGKAKQDFTNEMNRHLRRYRVALSQGIKPEDARFLLPEATKTKICMTMNARELFHFWDLRLDRAAQWEIRNLAFLVWNALKGDSRQWSELCQLWMGQLDEGGVGEW